MKFAIFFRKDGRKRAASRKSQPSVRALTVREWADMPPYHPEREVAD